LSYAERAAGIGASVVACHLSFGCDRPGRVMAGVLRRG
jgi:hypothetical protein